MLLQTGLPVVVALAELGVIVWLWLSRRNDRRKIIELTLRARRAELRVPLYTPETYEPTKGAEQ